MQVADRWHIVHNLADALERMAVRVLAPLHKQRSADELSTLDNQRTTATLSTLSRIQIRNERRHTEIHALRSRGLTIAAIADQLHLNRTTVRRFIRVTSAADLRRPPARDHADAIGSLRTWSAAGRKAARLLRTCVTRSRRSGIAVASERSDDLWRIGARRKLRHPSAAYCLARRLCAGFYCDAVLNWTTPNA
jgi:hypothetical protein